MAIQVLTRDTDNPDACPTWRELKPVKPISMDVVGGNLQIALNDAAGSVLSVSLADFISPDAANTIQLDPAGLFFENDAVVV